MVLDDTKKSKRFGFVAFSRATDAKTVLTAGDFFLMGKRIVVGPAVKRVVRKNILFYLKDFLHLANSVREIVRKNGSFSNSDFLCLSTSCPDLDLAARI